MAIALSRQQQRRVVLRARKDERRKPLSAKQQRLAFKAAKVAFAKVNEIAKQFKGAELIAELRNMPKLRHRGKGRGTPSRNYFRPYAHAEQGQGLQERLRRVIGGWAWHQRKGAFYDPSQLHTKNATLGVGRRRQINAYQLLTGERLAA